MFIRGQLRLGLERLAREQVHQFAHQTRLRVTEGAFTQVQPLLAARVLNKEYFIEVKQIGQEIRMIVNSVPVIERVLSQPLGGSQLGLFA